MKIIEYIKNTFTWKKTPNELNNEEKNAYESIKSISKDASWDKLNFSLYNYLKSANNQSSWKYFGMFDKYTSAFFIGMYTLIAFLLSASFFGIVYAILSLFLSANLPLGIGFIDSIMLFITKASLALACIGSPIYLSLRFFSFLKDKTTLSINKDHLSILNNEKVWMGIDDNLKKGFEKAISLPLTSSWWDKMLGILKEYGKTKENQKDEIGKESLFVKIIEKEKITESNMN